MLLLASVLSSQGSEPHPCSHLRIGKKKHVGVYAHISLENSVIEQTAYLTVGTVFVEVPTIYYFLYSSAVCLLCETSLKNDHTKHKKAKDNQFIISQE